jgi:hypothetical protein
MPISTASNVRRRSAGEGSVYQNGDRWRGAATCGPSASLTGRPANGQPAGRGTGGSRVPPRSNVPSRTAAGVTPPDSPSYHRQPSATMAPCSKLKPTLSIAASMVARIWGTVA